MAMRIDEGFGKVVLIRVTKGGAVTAFDFRERVNEGEFVCFRVFDKELPPELAAEFEGLVDKIGLYAKGEGKIAMVEQLRDTLNVFEAREKATDEYKAKMKALLAKSKSKGVKQ